ncbi:MAG: BON domain-containing protein [Armatimonadetes bacterium]|nr:BON domain-containing protein [Armatimonadota bacterium]
MKTLRDEAVTQLIVSRLNSDLRTGGQTIDVYVSNGDIFLVGTCDSEDQRAAAEMIARGTCGAHVVVDNIRVRKLRQSI